VIDLELARRLTSDEDSDVRSLAEWAVGQLQPNGEPLKAIVDGDGVVRCPECGNNEFGYQENCVDYRTFGEQKPEKRTIYVVWHIDGAGESGDDNPGLICDPYQSPGCGRPIELPEGWEVEF
jgi:hypothetical protein